MVILQEKLERVKLLELLQKLFFSRTYVEVVAGICRFRGNDDTW